jgi:hypothetical protein
MTIYTLTAGEYSIEIRSPKFETAEEAWALQNTFATSSKMQANRLLTSATATTPAITEYVVRASAGILPNGSNGGTNETGIRRFKSIFKTIDKAGDTIKLQASNTFASVQEFRDHYGI